MSCDAELCNYYIVARIFALHDTVFSGLRRDFPVALQRNLPQSITDRDESPEVSAESLSTQRQLQGTRDLQADKVRRTLHLYICELPDMSLLNSHRRSLSEVYSLDYLTTLANNAAKISPEEHRNDHLPFIQDVHRDSACLAALKHRSKSGSFICTAQGVVFKCQKYQSKVTSLMTLASTSSSSQCNVLLAKKALRYRKVLERRCVMA